MNKLENRNGITLIALVITIIVLLILAGISVSMITNQDGILNKAINAKKASEEATKREERQLSELSELIENNGEASLIGYNEDKKTNSPRVTGSTSEESGLIPIKYNGTNWVVCSETDKEWYNYADQNESPKQELKWANAMLSDGKYKAGEVKEGQVVEENELGSMFVWIPRFAYSMTKYKAEVEGATDANNGKTQNITKVVFLKGTTNEDKDGNTYPTDYDITKQTAGEKSTMIVHPAFTFGGANLRGIWVAKFEASMAETNENTTIANNDNASTKTVKVLPNAESWRYIMIGKSFEVCYNMKSKDIYKLSKGTDTHLIKNNEWGAVAYLAASQYGVIPSINTSVAQYESEKYHSYTGAGDYKTNITQSTTGNVTGIYDLNGGAWERVAAYWDNGSSSLNVCAGKITVDGKEVKLFSGNKLNSEFAAYWDKYDVSEDEKTNGAATWAMANNAENIVTKNTNLAKYAYDRVQLMKNIKGDAIYEVINGNDFSYYGIRYYGGKYTEQLLKATYDDKGNVIATNHEVSSGYTTGLYDGDYMLIGTFALPFINRGGYWANSTMQRCVWHLWIRWWGTLFLQCVPSSGNFVEKIYINTIKNKWIFNFEIPFIFY